MSIIFVIVKLYPFFGVSLAFLMVDLARTFKRRANKNWITFLVLAAFFVVSSVIWLVFRGDKNADLWVSQIQSWF